MNTTVHHGRFSSRITSPSPQVSNLIRSVVPSSAREYSAHDGVWVVYASRVPALIAALRAAGVEVVEVGGAA